MENISVILSAYVGGPTSLLSIENVGLLGGSPLHLRLTGGHGTDSMALWRIFKKGNSASQQCCRELPRGGLHSARVMIMEKQEDTQIYRGGVFCVSVVLPLEQIAMRLDGEHMEKKVAADGVQIRLPEDMHFLTRQLCNDMSNVGWVWSRPCCAGILPKKQRYSMLLHCPIGFIIFEFSLVTRVLRTKLVQWFHQLSIIDGGKIL